MTTIRVATRTRYTHVTKALVNDSRLSFRARGVLVWLLDKPDDWRANAESIARQSTEGRDAIRTALRELEHVGYVVRSKRQVARGRWETEVTVYETPVDKSALPTTENPSSASPGKTLQNSWSRRRLGNRRPENRPSEDQALKTLIPETDTQEAWGASHEVETRLPSAVVENGLANVHALRAKVKDAERQEA